MIQQGAFADNDFAEAPLFFIGGVDNEEKNWAHPNGCSNGRAGKKLCSRCGADGKSYG